MALRKADREANLKKARDPSTSPQELVILAEENLKEIKFAISEKDLFVSTVPPYHIYGLLFSVLVPLLLTLKFCPIFIPSLRKSFPRPINIKPPCWSVFRFIIGH